MAAKQGLNRLLKGATKKITNSEAKRGYFYVTSDVLAIDRLGENFNVVFLGHVLKNRNIDSYGRISVGRPLLLTYRNKLIRMKIEGSNLVVRADRERK